MNSTMHVPEDFLAGLNSDDAAARLAAARALAGSDAGPAENLTSTGRSWAELLPLVRVLEQKALHDPSDDVRRAALQALAAPRVAAAHRRLSNLLAVDRRIMLAQISVLERDGLIDPALAQILSARYALDTGRQSDAAPRPGTSAAAGERPPAPALSQLLLSETSVKVALYLGAFFVVAAAFILAALIEVARLPILAAATLLFFGAAFGLFRRLPMASFVLFTVAGLMVPIVAGVLAAQLRLPESDRVDYLYWAGVGLAAGLVWAAGVRFYVSRLYSLLAYSALALAGFSLAQGLFAREHAALLAVAGVSLGGLFAAQYLRGRYGPRLFWPLFVWIQAWQILTLVASLGVLAFEAEGPAEWRLAVVLWGMGVAFYVLSERAAERAGRPLPFALAAVFCAAMLLPLVLNAVEMGVHADAAGAWLWAAALLAVGEALAARLSAAAPVTRRLYPPALLAASGVLFVGAASIWAGANHIGLQIAALLAAAGVYLALALRRPRWAWWSAALVMLILANFAFHSLPAVIAWGLFPGFVPLTPALALLALELALRRGGAGPSWSLPALVFALLLSVVAVLVSGTVGFEQPGDAALAFVALGLAVMVYAAIDGRAVIGYAGMTALALALLYALIDRKPDDYLSPLIGLAIGYDVVGLALARLGRPAAAEGGTPGEEAHSAAAGAATTAPAYHLPGANLSWAAVLQSGGLALGFIAALAAPFQGGAGVIVATAALASLFVVEAYRRDWIWLGFPAAVLFFIAYGVALWELDVRQPQYYSIFAALLGIIMYHLLARRRHTVTALLTGLLAQLTLLSTTYLQMVGGEDFTFFFILFFQALALLIYGLVVRSRSFVIAPLIALVVSVITVALTVLSGLPTALIIGCTGILLILIGIAALLLRERLAQAADHWVGRLEMP